MIGFCVCLRVMFYYCECESVPLFFSAELFHFGFLLIYELLNCNEISSFLSVLYELAHPLQFISTLKNTAFEPIHYPILQLPLIVVISFINEL